MRKILIIILLCTLGCTTFKPAEPYGQTAFNYDQEGYFFGSINLTFNQKKNSGECNAKFTQNGKSILIKIEKNGKVQGLASDGDVKLKALQCGKHQYTFSKPHQFQNTKGRRKTFIGNLSINWKLGSREDWLRATSRVFGLPEYASSSDQIKVVNSSLKNRKLASDMLININLLKVP